MTTIQTMNFPFEYVVQSDSLHYFYPDDCTQCPADNLDHYNSKEHTTEYAQYRCSTTHNTLHVFPSLR